MQASDIRRVLVVGAGNMGQQIALQCALHGCEVALHDVAPAALEGALARVRARAARMADAGHLARDRAEAALARITAQASPEAAAREADLLTESVPEDPRLKGEVLGAFDRLCPPRAIFTTNTSTLLPSAFAAATGRPDRFAALHFHNPVAVANVVDVMPHAGTAPEVPPLLEAFARRIGQIPILLRVESPGYVFNALYAALNTAALRLAAAGVASVEDIDRAWMGIMKMPIGVFGMLDGVGLDTVRDITAHWARASGDPQLAQNVAFLERYLAEGRTGAKSGRGFYDYPEPAFGRPGFLEGTLDTRHAGARSDPP